MTLYCILTVERLSVWYVVLVCVHVCSNVRENSVTMLCKAYGIHSARAPKTDVVELLVLSKSAQPATLPSSIPNLCWNTNYPDWTWL
jgi:hypothetical protein